MSGNTTPMTSIARGFRGRTLKTAKLATKAGFKLFKKTFTSGGKPEVETDESAEKVAEQAGALLDELDDMKGLMMKFGQMASYLEGSLPPAAQQVLSRLQSQSRPMAWEAVEGLLTEELGGAPDELFDAFEREPFAAASIGQVHRAELDGRAVAVKVQYPYIEKAMKSDLRTLGVFTRLATMLGPLAGGSLVKELGQRVLDECDYEQEAASQVLFAELFGHIDGASVPAVVPERCARRVITTELSDRQGFYDFIDSASPEARSRAGRIIFQAVFDSVFRYGAFNADPHPGNYLFDADGNVTFLDFGCVRHFEVDFIERWKRLARLILADDRDGFPEAMTAAGLGSRKKRFDWDYQWEMANYMYQPIKSAEPFTFTHEYVKASFGVIIWDNPNKLKLGMPPEWLFLNRLQWGLYSVLAHLGATADWGAIYRDAVMSPTTPVAGGGRPAGSPAP